MDKKIADCEYLSQFVSYNPEDGRFYWAQDVTKGRKAGDCACTDLGDGYKQITLKGRRCLSHRLAFYLEYGYLPEQVDHKRS